MGEKTPAYDLTDAPGILTGEDEVMNEWQKIETAPKDGTYILTIRYNNAFEVWDVGVVKWVEGTWKVMPTRDMRLSLLGTHWMPLPEPPK